MRQVREQVALFTPTGPQGIQLWANSATQELAALAQEFGFRLNRVAPLDGSENFTSQVTFEAGIKILDSTGADSAVFSHDGTDFNTAFTNTTDWNLTGLAVFKLFDGCGLQIFDSTDADSALFSHDGTDFNSAFTNTTDWNLTGLGGGLNITGNATVSGEASALRLRVTTTDDVSLASTLHGFQIGATSGLNISMDNNEIMARNNGAASPLHLNINGGNINVSSDTTIDFGSGIGEKLSLWGGIYGIGIESGTQWYKANAQHRFYLGEPDGGTSDVVEISAAGISTSGTDTNPGALRSSLSSNMLHIDGKEVIDGNDGFLRLNQNLEFSEGVYTPGPMRADGGFHGDAGAETVSTPHFSWDESPDTGMCRLFSNAASMSAGGTEVMRFGAVHVRILNGATLTFSEVAAANSDAAGHGQLWVKNTTPNQLWFTDDAGNDTRIV